MTQEEIRQSMKDNVLSAIESGHLKIKPKWRFVLHAAWFGTAVVLLGLFLLYLASFIVFMLRQTGVWFAPGFGFEGLGVFFLSLPWILLLLVVIVMVLLELLVRHYGFAYRRPVVYSALGVILLVVLGGVAIGYTSFHQDLFDRAERGSLPLAGSFYLQFGRAPDNLTPGKILAITPSGYSLRCLGGELENVVVTPQTRLPGNINFAVGDVVLVLGPHRGETIYASAIQKPSFLPPLPNDQDDQVQLPPQ